MKTRNSKIRDAQIIKKVKDKLKSKKNKKIGGRKIENKDIKKEMKKMNDEKTNGKLEINYLNGVPVKLKIEIHKNLKK